MTDCDPQIIEVIQGGMVGMSAAQEILESRGILIVDADISKASLAPAFQKLLEFYFDPTFNEDIQIILNSPGGESDAGWAFIDIMDFVKTRLRIRTIALGSVASMATMIFVNGDERIMGPNTVSMLHQYSTFLGGTHADLLASRKMQDEAHSQMVRHLQNRSKYETREQVEEKLLRTTDTWMTPEDMLAHGLADTVWTPQKKQIS